MRSHAKSNLIPFLVVLAGLLALPAVAQASLTFVRGVSHPAVYVANDNGKGAGKDNGSASPKLRGERELKGLVDHVLRIAKTTGADGTDVEPQVGGGYPLRALHVPGDDRTHQQRQAAHRHHGGRQPDPQVQTHRCNSGHEPMGTAPSYIGAPAPAKERPVHKS